jgi:hypothetical protein
MLHRNYLLYCCAFNSQHFFDVLFSL